MLGGHLCWGLTLPKDKVIMAAVGPLEACTKIMASLYIVSVLSCLFLKHTFPLSDILLVLTHVKFNTAPWASVVTDHIKALKADAGMTRARETWAVKAEAELKTARDRV